MLTLVLLSTLTSAVFVQRLLPCCVPFLNRHCNVCWMESSRWVELSKGWGGLGPLIADDVKYSFAGLTLLVVILRILKLIDTTADKCNSLVLAE